MHADPTASLRRSCYLILTWIGVAIATGKIFGVENVIEPSRFKPPSVTHYGGDRPELQQFTKSWPSIRPEPTPLFSSNDRSRWATVRALVENGTYVIGQRLNREATEEPFGDTGIIFEDGWTSVDKVMDPATGKFYSTKPPLFATMLAAEYWVLNRTIGWQFNRDKWPIIMVGLFTVNVVPFAIYLILLARLIEQFGTTDFGRVLTFATAAVGTFHITFSATLNNHSPAIFCTLFTLYPLMRKSHATRFDLLVSGFFAGLTATFELPAAAFAAGVLAVLILREPQTKLAWYIVGALVPVMALLACNYAAMGRIAPAYGEFGGPWYRYPGSHWLKLDNPNARGIDFNKQGTLVYAFNLLLGHHGWFSLTPVWCVALYGLVQRLRTAERRWAWMTLIVSMIVFAFYLTRTKSYNYGGNTAAARWLIWLTPLWLMGLLAGADRLAASRLWRNVAAALLGLSVVSVFYPAWNPWRAPWLLQLAEYYGWVNYG